MAQRISFAEMKAEQAKMTESWKAEGRLSDASVVADPLAAKKLRCSNGAMIELRSGAIPTAERVLTVTLEFPLDSIDRSKTSVHHSKIGSRNSGIWFRGSTETRRICSSICLRKTPSGACSSAAR
jgi:hypothetical protein